jgi:hypothetical protein
MLGIKNKNIHGVISKKDLIVNEPFIKKVLKKKKFSRIRKMVIKI